MEPTIKYGRTFEPKSEDWRSFAWSTGLYDTALRSYTNFAEGTIKTPSHLLMVTLRGGAKRLEVGSDCGHRFAGVDRVGAVSFVPAHCGRRLRMFDVKCEWASISLKPEIFDCLLGDDNGNSSLELTLGAFTNVDDSFIAGLVGEFSRLYRTDGIIETTYCETMTYALASYVARKYGQQTAKSAEGKSLRLTPWQIRRLDEYVDAYMGTVLRIPDLASQLGFSVGHFHRSFHATVGITPLRFINHKRIGKAVMLLSSKGVSVADAAKLVGFMSPSHFARIFRQVTGRNPSEFVARQRPR